MNFEESDNFLPESPLPAYPRVKLDKNTSIGISAYGNYQTTKYALTSLFLSVEGDFELILVDDASPDDTGSLFEFASQYHANTKLFRFKRNQEYSGSLNAILSHATGQRIIFISNDIFITPAWINQLLEVTETQQDVGIVRGCANFVDNGLLTHNIKDCGDLDNFESLFEYAQNRRQQFDTQVIDDPFLTGDAFLVTRKLLDKIGYLDPIFYGYFADHDFALRARRAGFKTLLAMGAFCWHQHGSNLNYLSPKAREEKLKNRWARVNENWARFKEKYNLPVEMPYKGMRRIPWDGLIKRINRPDKFIGPVDYSGFLTPVYGTDDWLQHRASDMAQQARKLMQSAKLRKAATLCKQALLLDEESTEALTVLGSVQAYQGNVSAAIKTLRKAIRLDASNDKAYSNLLLCMNYSGLCKQEDIYKTSKKWAKNYKDRSVVLLPPKRSRIRIAYISPDFRRHSVSYFFLPLLENHDRTRFEIFCISDVAVPDDITDRMVALTDGWRDIYGLTNGEAEKVINEVAPDILVDLAGHTGHTIRLPLFANRPAPVQVSWLGYPNTTGMTQIGYRLTDAIADPELPEVDALYSEKLIRLPGCFLCYQPPDDAPDVSPPPALKNGYITFGCFNMLPKLQDEMIKTWSDILHQVEGSRLVLKNHYLSDAATARNLLKRFEKQGIDKNRIKLLPSNATTKEHLEQYSLVDIALDTFPYNGTTTTCEALWMGVPVVTLAGDRHAARVGVSILSNLELADCIAVSFQEYCILAISQAQNLNNLQKLRKSMRAKITNSVLSDAIAFAKNAESCFNSFAKERGGYNEGGKECSS